MTTIPHANTPELRRVRVSLREQSAAVAEALETVAGYLEGLANSNFTDRSPDAVVRFRAALRLNAETLRALAGAEEEDDA